MQENTKTNMEKMMSPPGSRRRRPEHLPAEQRQGHAEAHVQGQDDDRQGRRRIDLYYFGRGHTNGDAWVVFPALRFAHAGDIFAGKNLPLLDTNNGGSGVDIGNTLAKAHAGDQERRLHHHRPQHAS